MKNFLVVANWKAHTMPWEINGDFLVKVVIACGYNYLAKIKDQKSNIFLCSQDISKYSNGSYTGEVTGEMLKGIVEYCLVGHSERRRLFNETNEDINEKIKHGHENNIIPIIFARNEKDLEGINLDKENDLLCYEPEEAISRKGEYQQVNYDQLRTTLEQWQIKYGCKLLYGGSVNSENIGEIMKNGGELLNGVVVGKASLDKTSFTTIVENIKNLI